MKFLSSSKAWRRWAAITNRGQPQSPIDPPKSFPCFAYLIVASFNYEEEPQYLYPEDILAMASKISQ